MTREIIEDAKESIIPFIMGELRHYNVNGNGEVHAEQARKDLEEICCLAIKALEQEPKPMVEIDLYSVIKQKYIEREVLDKIRAEIFKFESDCRLSIDEYPSCKQCTDNVFKTIYGILGKYKAESEG